MRNWLRCFVWLSITIIGFVSIEAFAFTYQGRLNDGPKHANGLYDFQFTIYNAATEGDVVGETLTYLATSVSNGIFTVVLDFGAASFDGGPRWLEIMVRRNRAPDFYTLSPRTEITPTPYALYALNVGSNGIAGPYGESVTFNHSGNVFVGSFTGDGGTLTNVDAATWGGLSVTNLWQMSSNALAAAIGVTNVFAGGTVVTTNVTVRVPSELWTNASAFLGYGGLQLPTAWYGQTWEGNENPRSGIEWWQTGWDGTGLTPDDHTTLPEAAIQVARKWGGRYAPDLPTMHLWSKGAMRLEPVFSSPDAWGKGYLALGNEDANPPININYCLPSIFTNIPGSIGGQIPYARGHSLPLQFLAPTSKNGVPYFARPGIVGWGGATNAGTDLSSDHSLRGELWFYTRTPTPDFDAPQFNNEFIEDVVVGKMLTNGWNLLGRLVYEQALIAAANGTNYALDFNAASFSTIRLTSTVTNQFYITNLVTAANEFEPRTFRILSGDSNRPLRWPTRWTVVTESGNGSLPALLAAKKVLHLRLESWGPNESDIVARFAIGTEAPN